MKTKSILSYEDGYKIIWKSLDILRGAVSDYKVVPYIIHVYRKGFLDSYSRDDYPDVFIDNYLRSHGSFIPVYERDLFRVYQPILYELRSSISQFTSFLKQLSSCDEQWFEIYETRFFDDLLTSLISLEGKGFSEYIQSQELSHFVAQLSGYKGNGTLYNPFAGSATYCTELVGEGHFVAQEKALLAWGTGIMRLVAHQIDPSTFYCEDSVRQWRGLSSFAEDSTSFDCIVATPPFGSHINHGESSWAYGDISFVDDLFIRDSLSSLTSNGVAIGVFMQGIAYRTGKSYELRQHFIDTDRLDTVVALPAGVFFPYTNIPTIILKFSNRKNNPGFVRMVNGVSFSETVKGHTHILFDKLFSAIQDVDERVVKVVSIAEIKGRDYNILPSRYFTKPKIIPKGFELYKFSDLVEFVSGERCLQEEKNGKVITVANLSDNPFEYQLDIDALTYEPLSNNVKKITSPVLLISKIRKLKPTFAKASEAEPIYINPGVLACRVKEGVPIFIPELIRALSQVEDIQTGAYIPSINMTTIRSIEVVLPMDVSIQEKIYYDAKREFKEAKVRELGLEELMATQKKEFIYIIRRRKHDMDNMLGDIRNSMYAISGYITKKGLGDDLIDEDLNLSVSQLFEHLQNSFSSLSNVIKHLDDEEVYAEPEVIDLVPRLKALAAEFHPNYTIRYSEDPYSLLDVVVFDDEEYCADVKFGSVNLDRVFFNIIQNAEKHGFTDPSRKDYVIDIEISHDYDSDFFVIRFKNNGNPLPLGMDTRRYGTKAESAGTTAGNGEGGAIIKSTVEHYGGTVELISHPDECFPVCVELRIPRYDDYEREHFKNL